MWEDPDTRTLGDAVHIVALWIVLYRVFVKKNAQGISLQTQALLCFCATIRLIVFLCMLSWQDFHWYSIYISLFFSSASGLTCYFANQVSPVDATKTTEACVTSLPTVVFAIAIAFPLVMVINLVVVMKLSGFHLWEGVILWSNSMESFCLIPQIIMHQRYYQNKGGMGTFLLFMGLYHFLNPNDAISGADIYENTQSLAYGIQAILAVGGLVAPYRQAVYHFCDASVTFAAPWWRVILVLLLNMLGFFLFPTLFLEGGFLVALVVLGFYFRYILLLSRELQRQRQLESSEESSAPPGITSTAELDGVEDIVVSEVEISEGTTVVETGQDKSDRANIEGEDEDEEGQQTFLSCRELKILACVLGSSITIVSVPFIEGSVILESSGMIVVGLLLLVLVVFLVCTYENNSEEDQCLSHVVRWFRHPFWLLVLLSLIFTMLDGIVDLPPGAFILMLAVLFSPFSFLAYFVLSVTKTKLACCNDDSRHSDNPSMGEKSGYMNVPLLSDFHLDEVPHQELQAAEGIQIV